MTDGFNLDDVDYGQSAPEPEDTSGPQAVTTTEAPTIKAGDSLHDLIDSRTKLVFVIDISSSMSETAEGGEVKIQVVKQAAKKFVEHRFKKWPKALVSLFEFNSNVRVLAQEASKDRVLTAINGMYSYGYTDIIKAIRAALMECGSRSSGGYHHIVMVTDGEDQCTEKIKRITAEVVSMGVVFDVIRIKSSHDYQRLDDVYEALERLDRKSVV